MVSRPWLADQQNQTYALGEMVRNQPKHEGILSTSEPYRSAPSGQTGGEGDTALFLSRCVQVFLKNGKYIERDLEVCNLAGGALPPT